jgi:hypothetical protein
MTAKSPKVQTNPVAPAACRYSPITDRRRIHLQHGHYIVYTSCLKGVRLQQ